MFTSIFRASPAKVARVSPDYYFECIQVSVMHYLIIQQCTAVCTAAIISHCCSPEWIAANYPFYLTVIFSLCICIDLELGGNIFTNDSRVSFCAAEKICAVLIAVTLGCDCGQRQ